MPLIKIPFKPGINREIPEYANEGGYDFANLIRFRMGYAEKLGGWANTSPNYTFNGIVRSIANWISLLKQNLLGFGTTQQMYVQNELGTIYHNITPIAYTASFNASSISTVAVGSSVLEVKNVSGSIITPTPNNGLDVGSIVYFYCPTTSGVLLLENQTSGPNYFVQETGTVNYNNPAPNRFSIGSGTQTVYIGSVSINADYKPNSTLATPYEVISVSRKIYPNCVVNATTTTVTLTVSTPDPVYPLANTWILVTGLDNDKYNGTVKVLTSSYSGSPDYLLTLTYANSSGVAGVGVEGTINWVDSFRIIGSGSATSVTSGSAGLPIEGYYLPNIGNNTTQYLESGAYPITNRIWSQAPFGDNLIMAIQGNPIYYWVKDTTNWNPAVKLSDYANTQQYQQATVTRNAISSTEIYVDFNDYIYPGETITIASGSGSIPTSPTKITSISGLKVTLDNPVTVYTDGAILGGSLSGGSGYDSTGSPFTNVTLLGGTGTGAKATITVSGSSVNSVTITDIGSGYSVGDVLYQNNGGGVVTGTINNTNRVYAGTTTGGSGYNGGGSATYTNVSLLNVNGTTGLGSGAKATLTVTSGVVTAVTITDPGSGYKVGDVLYQHMGGPLITGTTGGTTAGKGVSAGTVAGGAGYVDGVYTNVELTNISSTGTHAEATITVSGGKVTSVVITAPGTAYQINDILSSTVLGSGGAGFTYMVTAVTPIGEGSGYANTGGGGVANISLTNITGNGSGAKATIIIATNKITSVNITAAGTGYNVGDVLSASDPVLGSGTGFTWTITSTSGLGVGTGFTYTVSQLSAGSGYSSSGPYTNIDLLGGSGTGAKATVSTANGAIYDVTVTTAGSKYQKGDVLLVDNTSIGGGTPVYYLVNSLNGLGAGTGFTYTLGNSSDVSTATVLDLSYSGQYVPTQTNKIFISNVYQFVIALGSNPYDPSNPNSDYDPLLVRWSDQSNPYQWIPRIDNQSGEQSLGNGSKLVTAVPNLQVILVFTDTSVYQMQYVGPPYTFSFTLLQENISIISQNAALTANNVTWWMGTDKFYMFNGSVQVLPCPIRRYVFTGLNKERAWQIVAGYNEGFSEIWWFYPSASSTINDSYVKFNFTDNVWDYGSLNRTAWNGNTTYDYPLAAHTVQNTYLTSSVSSTATTIDVADTSSYHTSGVLKIDSELIPYTGKTATSFIGCSRPNGVTHTAYTYVKLAAPNQVMFHEYGVNDNSVPNVTLPVQSFIQSSDIGLADGNDLVSVGRIIPDLTFTNSTAGTVPVITTTIYPRLNPGSNYQMNVDTPTITAVYVPVNESEAFPPEQYTGQPVTRALLTAGQGQIYTRVRGRTIALRVDTGDLSSYITIDGYPLQVPANSIGNMWQLGLMRFDVRKDGRR